MPPRQGKGKKRPHFAEDLGALGEDDGQTASAAPATATEAIIEDVLDEEDRGKEQAKAMKQGKGKDLVAVEEVEAAEEDGVVLPSRIKKAQTLRRKARAQADDTELLPDNEVQAVEEDLQMAHDDGIELEPFNLVQERAEGHFDESGHYVENKQNDEVKDAWLDSAEGKDVSEKVRRQVAEREAAMQAAEGAPPMSTVQIAQLKAIVGEVLQAGETVTRGLKRLGAAAGSGARRPGKRAAANAPPGKGAAAQLAATPLEQAAAKADFNRLTEAASQLMDAGELDVYSLKQEDFAKAGTLFVGKRDAGGAEKNMFADDDDDMFAASDEEGAAKPPAAKRAAMQAAAGAATSGAPAAGGSAPTAGPPEKPPAAAAARADTSGAALGAAADTTDYASWPTKELARFLRERGQDSAGIVEKSELVAKVRQAAAAAPHGEPLPAPPGYTLDPATGYHYSAESRMFYDSKSNGYYGQDDQKWYGWDGDKFVLMEQEAKQ